MNADFPKIDLVVVGAGPAGLSAAAEAARLGGRVVVLDEGPHPGGRLRGQFHPRPRGWLGGGGWSDGAEAARSLTAKASSAGVEIICGMSVWGVFAGWFVGVAPTDPAFKGQPLGYRARAVITATGATQHPLPLPGWTLPGVITAGAAQSLINVHQVLPGRRAVVVGADPLALMVAQLMSAVGVEVWGIVLPPANGLHLAPASPRAAVASLARLSAFAPSLSLNLLGRLGGSLNSLAARLFPSKGLSAGGLRLMLRRAAVRVDGRGRVEAVRLVRIDSRGRMTAGGEVECPVEAVVTSAGLKPLIELAQAASCPLMHLPDLGGWVPLHGPGFETPLPGLFVAGSMIGVEGAAVAQVQGRMAGLSAAAFLGLLSPQAQRQNLAQAEAELRAARREALPFLTHAARGRQEMAREWARRTGDTPPTEASGAA